MEQSGGNSGGSVINSRRSEWFSISSFIQAPLSALLEYSGLVRTSGAVHQEMNSLLGGGSISPNIRRHAHNHHFHNSPVVAANNEEVAIRIIGAGEDEQGAEISCLVVEQDGSHAEVLVPQPAPGMNGDAIGEVPDDLGPGTGEAASPQSSMENGDGDTVHGVGASGRDSPYQRYDIQQAARWLEQVLPFSLLLLVVFIRQHLQGFFLTIWIAVVMFKSNDILRKQTALKGDRKVSVLIGIAIAFLLHIIGVYWWYHSDDLLHPLIMVPPNSIPPFWHCIFIIMMNDTLVRQFAMGFKCLLLIYYRNSRGRNFRKQGQMLTLVEYLLLLYRSLLPTSVWYRFFLNKEYGSLFSSLMTGLYLTFKLTSIVEKVQLFFTALKALSHKEVHYGAYATLEQVTSAGDLCAICQEKMNAPILLRCKHIFCEDCVSEWFERERTCPLCRALVKPAGLKSFGDGSTTLFYQIF